MSVKPLLSVCIPTFNRAGVLQECVESIVRCTSFGEGKIEIVVSDNVSTDETMAIMEGYVEKYEHILYNRNEKNIGGDLNFIKVLSLASGVFIKLHNDYCVFTEDGLNYMVHRIDELRDEKPFIFMCSTEYPMIREFQYKDLDDLVYREFIGLSWISAVGFWKEDFLNLPNKDRMLSIKFMQTDWLLRIAKEKNMLIRWKGDLFHRIQFGKPHGDFNYISTFINYPKVFEEYIKQGQISPKTQRHMDNALLENLSIWYYRLNIRKNSHYSYSSDNVYTILKSHFKCIRFWQLQMVGYIVKCAILDFMDYLHINEIKKLIKMLMSI